MTLFKLHDVYCCDNAGYPQQQPPTVPQPSYPPPGSYPPQQPTAPASVDDFQPPPDYSSGKVIDHLVLRANMDLIKDFQLYIVFRKN